ncbi:MAG: alpha/beta fold hydrolase [Alphaproteobacteria bacterium]|nr:alpha/beta fold hydrolase [Alphaproteobacteria bacterium]
MFMGGFMSDMSGTKATFFEEQCKKRGQAYLRFDYTGHGVSSGKFTEGNIGSWLQDALDVFDELTQGPQIVVGSSMGGWLSLLLTLQRAERVAGLVCLAPAPDFTEDIYHLEFDDAARAQLAEKGIVHRPSDYGDPYPLTRQLFEDGRKHLLLKDEIGIRCPVRLIHGKQDPDVPWQKSGQILEKLASQDAKTVWIEDGDHRLSRDQDLALIDGVIEELSEKARGA